MVVRGRTVRAVALLGAIAGTLWFASCDVTSQSRVSATAILTPTTRGHTLAASTACLRHRPLCHRPLRPRPPASAGAVQLCTATAHRRGLPIVFRQVGPVWTGGDGGGTVDLEDGRRLWLFGDMFSGPVNATSILAGWHMVNNSIGIEQNNCLTFKTGGSSANPASWVPARDAGEWLWLLQGWLERGPCPVVKVTALRMRRTAGQPGWNWQVAGTDLITLDYKTLAPLGTVALPAAHGITTWGTGVLDTAGYVYLYGRPEDPGSTQHYVARVPPGHADDVRMWQFWNGTAWSEMPRANPLPTL